MSNYQSKRPPVGHPNFVLTYSHIKLEPVLDSVESLLPDEAIFGRHQAIYSSLARDRDVGIQIELPTDIKHIHGDTNPHSSITETREVLFATGTALATSYAHVKLTEEDDTGRTRVWIFSGTDNEPRESKPASASSVRDLLDRIKQNKTEINLNNNQCTVADGVTIMPEPYVSPDLSVRDALAYSVKHWKKYLSTDGLKQKLSDNHVSKHTEDFWKSESDNISGYYRLKIMLQQFENTTTNWGKQVGNMLGDLSAPLRKEHVKIILDLPRYYEYEIQKDRIAKTNTSVAQSYHHDFDNEPLRYMDKTIEYNPRYEVAVYHFKTYDNNYVRLALDIKRQTIEDKLLDRLLDQDGKVHLTGYAEVEERDGFRYYNVTRTDDISVV